MSTLDDAIQAIRANNIEKGRQILEEILEVEENNEEVWLWLSSVVDTDEDREICLENVLALNPDNIVAQRGLEALQSGTFNINSIIGEVFEEEETETTFIDDFVVTDEFDEDEELEFPSTMTPPTRKKAAKKGRGLNLRLILLGLFIVLIVLVLAGLAAVNIFFSGGDDSSSSPGEGQTQEVPAQGGEETPPEPTATDTPIPTPTFTLTPTNTPFQLPTPKPTDLPTPTATPVVAPTPG